MVKIEQYSIVRWAVADLIQSEYNPSFVGFVIVQIDGDILWYFFLYFLKYIIDFFSLLRFTFFVYSTLISLEASNFIHSSRKAWKMLKKLGTDASRQKSITANDIASRLLRVSKTQRDREYVRTTKMNLRRKKRTLTVNQTLSRNFSLDELETSLMSLKPGKAAGFAEINPEFIKNFSAQTKEWIISFMNDIVTTSKIHNLFKRAKVISIIIH
jgi:hypothetical protein